MTKQAHYIAALEIGSSKIVGAIAKKNEANEGGITVMHIVQERTINSVRYGNIQNIDGTRNCISRIIQQLEFEVNGKIEEIYVGVGGRSVHSETHQVSRTIPADSVISADIIKEIDKEARLLPTGEYSIFDALPSTFLVDKKSVINPVGAVGSSIQAHYSLVLGKTSIIKLNLQRVLDTGGYRKNNIVTALALAETVLTAEERDLGCVLVDMGAETTTISIYRHHALVYLITLPLGGRNITRDVMSLGVTEEKAENIKLSMITRQNNQSVIMVDGLRSDTVAEYIKMRVDEIVANINQQIINSGMSETDIRTIVVTGGASQQDGFKAALAETTKHDVREAQAPFDIRFNTITNPNIAELLPLLSILLKASHLSQNSCVRLNMPEEGPIINTPLVSTLANTPMDDEEPVKIPVSPKKPGFFRNLADRAKSILSEGTEDNF